MLESTEGQSPQFFFPLVYVSSIEVTAMSETIRNFVLAMI